MERAIERLTKAIKQETLLHNKITKALELQNAGHNAIMTYLKNTLDDLHHINPLHNGNDNAAPSVSRNRQAATNSDLTINRNRNDNETDDDFESETTDNSQRSARPRRTVRFAMPSPISSNVTSRNVINRRKTNTAAPTSSRKLTDFAGEPIGDKSVDKVPGIGPQACTFLKQVGIESAIKLLGKALISEKEEFISFLCDVGIQKHNATKAWAAIQQYARHNM